MIKSVFRYPGAKNKLLPILMEYMDPFLANSNSFYEPFVGGGSVSLEVASKYSNMNIILNDKDDWISNFWSVVSSNDLSKLNKLIDLLSEQPTIELFEYLSNTPPISDVDSAYRALFFNRTCFSGIVKRDTFKVKSNPIGGKEQKSKYKINCRFNFKKIKEKILLCHNFLVNRTTVYNLDIIDFLNKIYSNGVMYLDPPYYIKASMLYHEYMVHSEHQKLANSLKSKKNWLLSYDDCQEIKSMYDDCKIINLSTRYSINGEKTTWRANNELLIMPE